MSLRLKVVIAVLALGLSAFAILGDGFFVALGFRAGSGRIIVAGVMLFVGVVWFAATSASSRKNMDNATRRSGKKPGDKLG